MASTTSSPRTDPEKDSKETQEPPVNDGGSKIIGDSRPPMSLAREVVFVAVVCSAQLLTQAGLGQVVAPLHIIGTSFGNPSPGQLSWFAASYSLTIGTFILVAGRCGDIWGHKNLFVLGYTWYALWSLIAGLSVYSKNQIFFDFCRAMQGIGPAVLLPTSLALLGKTYSPGRRKNVVFSIFAATAPSGFVVGAVFASLLAQHAWWPWAYWCMSITCALCAMTAFYIIPSLAEEEGKDREPQTFDYLGTITGVAGLVLFNVAWNQAPIVGWQSPYVIVFLIVGLALFIAFCFVEARTRQPLIPMKSMTKEVGFVLGCIALGWASFGIWVFYLWQFLENIRMESPLLATAHQSPVAVAGCVASLVTSYLLGRIKSSYIMLMAMVAFCAGSILLATAPVDQTYWINTFLTTIITPFGMDMSFPAATILLSDMVPQEHQGIAASLVATVVNYSISIGLGIAGTVDSKENSNGTDVLHGYRGAMYAAIGLAGCGIILSLSFVYKSHRSETK